MTPAGGATTNLTFRGGDQQQLVTDGTTSLQSTQLGVTRSTTGGASTYYTRDSDGALATRHSSGIASYYLYDDRGNVSGLTDSSGAVTDTYTYDPYGRRSHTTGSNSQPFGFRAGYSTAGVVHFGARLYRPALARWTQPDPLPATTASGENPYSYAGCDPINGSDPSGLDPHWNDARQAAAAQALQARRLCDAERENYFSFSEFAEYRYAVTQPSINRRGKGGTSYELFYEYARTSYGATCHVVIRGGEVILKAHFRPGRPQAEILA